ncbi:MAG: hypothetical protein J1E63_07435 [Muribaculaceae bacterium]|nr:hypothetical protein [Muribaculaceae bacterium]
MKFVKFLTVSALLGVVGVFTSCSNDADGLLNPASQSALLRQPDIRAWSGSHLLGNTGTRNIGEDFYQVMPDFTEWCRSWNPAEFPAAAPAVPGTATVVTPANFFSVNFEEGGVYVLEGELANSWDGIDLANLPKNVTLYVDGKWNFFNSTVNDGIAENEYPAIIVLDNSLATFDQLDEDPNVLTNIKILNYGSTYIYNSEEAGTIGKGCLIYDAGYMVVEQNYFKDHGADEELVPIVVNEPIYSTGEVIFKGGVDIKADDCHFRKVCVDGQMTVEPDLNIFTGYLNTDELYVKDGATVNMAPEGMAVAGTIFMQGVNARIKGDDAKPGYILTNEIAGERKDFGGAVVNKSNFADLFTNVNFYVTKTINNSQDVTELLEYQPGGNGKTYPLNLDEFDASANDDVTERGVNAFECGVGYEFVPRVAPGQPGEEPGEEGPGDEPGEDNPGQDEPGDNVVCTDFTEVEINLSLNDSHSQYTAEDLVSKLSIHVRYPGDVEVFIPIPHEYYCEADDLDIIATNAGLYIPGQKESVSYTIGDNVVTLTVSLEDDGIRVTTDGINQEVLDYCYANFGDGLNFEVFNYFGRYEQIDGTWTRVDGERGNVARETILRYLNQATVKFLDEPYPDYYINAFAANQEGDWKSTAHDCSVKIDESQAGDYPTKEEGAHLNDSDYNQIYTHKDAQGSEHTHK